METGMIILVSLADRLGVPVPLSGAQQDFAVDRRTYGSCASDPGDVLTALRGGGGDDAIRRRLHLAEPTLPQ
jgi:hypothetical protein